MFEAFAAEGSEAADDLKLVLGYFNTDPGRAARLDVSAQDLAAAAAPPSRLRFLTDVGADVTPTYLGVFNIDHILAAGFTGTCWAAGLTPDRPPVTEMIHFDHTAIVCDITRGDA